MDQPDQEARPQFSQPVRQVLMMLVVLGLSIAVVVLALPRVLPVFEANPYLNGFILFVFVIGVLACFWQVGQLMQAVRWIESFAGRAPDEPGPRPPQLLAPLASLLRSRRRNLQIAASSNRSILDSVATRIDEEREITRYIVSLLIFLGLLGTFYGLATTVPALVDTIRSLAPAAGESGVEVFGRLMNGLEAQLSGMGVAFGSSLLGLAGSLVVGLLELFAGHGQNRFYRELEEWLSGFTRVGFSAGEGEGTPEAAMLGGLAEHMAAQFDALQGVITRSEASRAEVDDRLSRLLGAMEGQGGTGALAAALERVADGQERLVARLAPDGERHEGIDAESRMRLRSIDVQMLRILEELSAGRQETMSELRTELAALNRSLGRLRPGAREAAPHLRRAARPETDAEG